MNTDSGEFVEEERAEAWMKRLGVGEVVKIKGEELEVVEIEGRHVKLKLLSVQERLMKQMHVETDLNRHMRRRTAALERNSRK